MEQEQIEGAVDSIATDLGLGSGEQEETTADAEVVEGEESEVAASETTETTQTEKTEKTEEADAAATAQTARAAPKAWAKEKHEVWAKLDPAAQEYIEHREKQMLEGLSQYSDAAKVGKAWQDAVTPYMPLIKAQGIEAPQAVQYLFEAHKQLSAGTPEQKAAYLATIAKSYGIDIAKAAAGASASSEEPQSVKELRERTERLERERHQELRQRSEETTQRVASEVTAFADAKDEKGNPKHPYFDECAEDIVAYVNAGHTLDKAYEKAVYANPVTRAKELARLKTEEDAALRAKARQEAEKARNASRTNVTSRDTRRTPTAPTAKRWEDTLPETLKEIKARTH